MKPPPQPVVPRAPPPRLRARARLFLLLPRTRRLLPLRLLLSPSRLGPLADARAVLREVPGDVTHRGGHVPRAAQARDGPERAHGVRVHGVETRAVHPQRLRGKLRDSSQPRLERRVFRLEHPPNPRQDRALDSAGDVPVHDVLKRLAVARVLDARVEPPAARQQGVEETLRRLRRARSPRRDAERLGRRFRIVGSAAPTRGTRSRALVEARDRGVAGGQRGGRLRQRPQRGGAIVAGDEAIGIAPQSPGLHRGTRRGRLSRVGSLGGERRGGNVRLRAAPGEEMGAVSRGSWGRTRLRAVRDRAVPPLVHHDRRPQLAKPSADHLPGRRVREWRVVRLGRGGRGRRDAARGRGVVSARGIHDECLEGGAEGRVWNDDVLEDVLLPVVASFPRDRLREQRRRREVPAPAVRLQHARERLGRSIGERRRELAKRRRRRHRGGPRGGPSGRVSL